MRNFAFSRARTVDDAVARTAATPEAAFIGGGTTLVDLVKIEVMNPRLVVDVNHLGLDKIESRADGSLRIGAGVRNSELAWHPAVRERYPVLAEALLTGASSQLRNMATTAGNLMQRTRCPYFRDTVYPCNKRAPGSGCAAMDGYNRSHAVLGGSPACIATHPSDMCVALAVLNPTIHVQGVNGPRAIRYEDFHLLPGDTPEKEHLLQPGDLITSVELPLLPAGARSWYVKLRDRGSYEFALASAAVVVATEGARIHVARLALGGVATKPWRAVEAETSLQGAERTEENFRKAAEIALRGAQPRQHNAFKVELAKRAIVRAFTRAAVEQPKVRTI